MISWFKQHGFSPQEALEFIQEAWALSPVMLHPRYANSYQNSFLGQASEKLQQKLYLVQSPEEWKTYQKNWYKKVCPRTQTLKEIQSAKSSLAHSSLNLWSNQDLQKRLYQWSEILPEQKIIGFPVNWMDVKKVLTSQTIGWLKTEKSNFEKPNQEWLNTVQAICVEHGFHHLKWPIWHNNDSLFLSELSQKLEETKQVFSKAIGINAETSILGLKEHVGLRIGFEEKIRASCRIQGAGHSSIQLHARDPRAWQALGHEWFHSFDIWMGYRNSALGLMSEAADLNQKSAHKKRDWKNLITTLKESNTGTLDTWKQMQLSWVERWKASIPDNCEMINKEEIAWNLSDWNTDECVRRWELYFLSDDQPHSTWKACSLAAELEVLKKLPENKSVWRAVAERTTTLAIGYEKAEKNATYLEDVSEILAHSFEMQLGRINEEWKPELQTLRYAQGPEGVLHEKAWNTFSSQINFQLKELFPEPSLLKSEEKQIDLLGIENPTVNKKTASAP